MNLASMLDRPIAFQRSFVHLGAGITGALMLSQAVYWANRGSDDDGWFFKTQVEWEDETGLSRTEQETARKKLLSLGLMEEARRGIPMRRFGTPGEIAAAVYFLAGEEASYITGASLKIDGGIF